MTLGDGLFAYLSSMLSVGDRVYPLTLPQGAVLPAVVYQLVGGEGPLHSHGDAQDGDGTGAGRRTSAPGSSSAAGRTAPGRPRSWPPRSRRRSTASPGPGATVPIASALVDLSLDDCRPDVGRYRRIVDVLVQWTRTP